MGHTEVEENAIRKYVAGELHGKYLNLPGNKDIYDPLEPTIPTTDPLSMYNNGKGPGPHYSPKSSTSPVGYSKISGYNSK